MTTKYDHYFRLYASIYFDGLVDWPWFKAQAIAESGLDPKAVSPAGARGIMQIMPETGAEIARELWLEERWDDPRSSILFGIHYMYKMWLIWQEEKGLERLRFSLASYNAGAGNIIKAQRLAKTSDNWKSVAGELSRVTGSKAWETIVYVKKVERIRTESISA